MRLELAPADLADDQLNSIRYALCRLYYVNEDYYEAAVLGQFLARRYPSFAGARHAAQVAMASYYSLGKTAADDDFAMHRMVETADHIAQQWPGQRETEEALALLVSLMVRQGDVAKAAEYLDKIPPIPAGEARPN